MIRIALLLSLLAGPAMAQTVPLGLPQFADPPETNGAPVTVRPTGILHNNVKKCTQMVQGTAWECFITEGVQAAALASQTAASNSRTDAAIAAERAKAAADLAAARAALGQRIDAAQATSGANGTAITALQSGASALTSRVSALEMGSAKTSDLTAATSALNARIDSVQATAGAAVTQATLASAVTTLTGRADTNAAAISALTTRVATLESTFVSQAALASALATVNARIDGLQSGRRLCTSVNLTGISIPLVGLSTATAVALAGVPSPSTCDVAGATRLPLGAWGEAIVSTPGTVSVAFRGNSSLLSGIIAIPNGAYRVCCDS